MKKEKMLVLYFPLDDPIAEQPFELLDTYIRHGVRVIEIALPTENPVLDGKTIRDSMGRILSRKTLEEYIEDIKLISGRYPQIKIQVMAYYEIIRKLTLKKFKSLMVDAGISYLLSPDASSEQREELKKAFEPQGIYVISMCPYKLEAEEAESYKWAKGYIFQKSSDGKTGETHTLSEQLKDNIELLRANGVEAPIVIAFGISEKSQVDSAMKMGADGVVIGSALFSKIADGSVDTYLAAFDEWFVGKEE